MAGKAAGSSIEGEEITTEGRLNRVPISKVLGVNRKTLNILNLNFILRFHKHVISFGNDVEQ